MSGLKDRFLPLLYDGVPEAFRIKAKLELNETEENVEKGIAVLTECIKRENLPFMPDENFLIIFLRAAKFNFKKAEEKLKRFRKVWEVFAEELESVDIETFRAVIDHNMVGLLPFRDEQGRVLIYGNERSWDKQLFNMNDVFVCLVGLIIFAGLRPLTSICGFVGLVDFYVESIYDAYLTFNIYRKYIPLLAYNPLRVCGLNVINDNYFLRCLYMVIKPIIPAKIRNRIRFHGTSFKFLHEMYPTSLLPLEFGGTVGPLSPESYRDQFLDFLRSLKSQLQHGKQVKLAI